MIKKKKKRIQIKKKKEKKENKNLKKVLKEKFNIEDIKTYSKNMVKTTKYIILDNKLVFIYILGAVINGMILRGFTIGNPFNLRPVLADLVVSLIFASFYFLVKKKYRVVYLITISIVSIIVCISNIVYYFYYSSFISITFFSFALANHETGESNVVGDLIKPQFFIFLWLPLVLYIVNKKQKKKKLEDQTFKRVTRKTIFKTLYTWTLVFFIIFLSTLKPVDFSRLYSQWNREYLVSRFGVYMYQINDIVKSIEPKMSTLFGKDKAYKEINEYYLEEGNSEKKNSYSNIFKGKNVIAVHAESMQNVLINLKIGGKEITPNLNKLTKEGLYFENFYSQVSFGTSSDTEFTYATSLLPVSSGTVFINHSDKEYVSFYKLL